MAAARALQVPSHEVHGSASRCGTHVVSGDQNGTCIYYFLLFSHTTTSLAFVSGGKTGYQTLIMVPSLIASAHLLTSVLSCQPNVGSLRALVNFRCSSESSSRVGAADLWPPFDKECPESTGRIRALRRVCAVLPSHRGSCRPAVCSLGLPESSSSRL